MENKTKEKKSKAHKAPKYPRVPVSAETHVKIQKAAQKAGQTLEEYAESVFAAALA